MLVSRRESVSLRESLASGLDPELAQGGLQQGLFTLGVMLDGAAQEGWVVEAIRQAMQVPGVQLGTLAIIQMEHPTGPAARLHHFVDRLDKGLRCEKDQLFARVDAVAALGRPPTLAVKVDREGDRWQLSSSGVEALREARADVWLWLCGSAPDAPLPYISRLGVWGLEIGARVPAGSPWAGASEVSSRADLTFTQVVDYTQPGCNVVYQACGATIKNSARRNRLVALRKGVSFFGRLLRAMSPGAPVRTPSQAAEPVLSTVATARPSLSAVLRLSWRLAAEVLFNRWIALAWREQWRIGYYFADEEADAVCTSPKLQTLVPPKDRDWADPFIVCHAGRNFIFFEELPYEVGRAHISAVEIFPDGRSGPPSVVLQRPYHLSYPFVFAWKGDLYMLPETAGNHTVELYRCEQFPHRWILDRVLLDGIRAFDATLHREGQHWWMFVSVAEPGADPSEEMHVFWSDSPLGPWHPHAANPVVSDARHARGAGPLFRREGVLYRPSQDCSASYGSAVSINRVDVLDPENYQETPVGRIDPDSKAGMRCLHTIGAVGKLRVLDFRVRRPAWSHT
ncbi:MAG: hypothetical protein M3Y79_00520 [Pseudomonadota bacterium]|nr:hypothetical protein [Pseudomonadota bacterium]